MFPVVEQEVSKHCLPNVSLPARDGAAYLFLCFRLSIVLCVSRGDIAAEHVPVLLYFTYLTNPFLVFTFSSASPPSIWHDLIQVRCISPHISLTHYFTYLKL